VKLRFGRARRGRATEVDFSRRDGMRHSPQEVIRSFDDIPLVIFPEVTRAQGRQGIRRQRYGHVHLVI
jgi:1-acyl-sn-glycerol-3-phosphate acyltransferase